MGKLINIIKEEINNSFNKPEYVERAYEILKSLNEPFHHLGDDELQMLAKTKSLDFIELDTVGDGPWYYGGIITNDYDFYMEKYNETKERLDYYESISDYKITTNGKTYYYYWAGGYD